MLDLHINDNISYTYDCWLSYYVLDEAVDPNNPEFKHDLSNEVIYTFYHEIRHDDTTYIDLYTKQNVKYDYFVKDDEVGNTNFILKNEYREMLVYHFQPGESLGTNGKEVYDNLSNIFTIFYRTIMEDVLKNDLTYENKSYIELNNRLSELMLADRWIFATCIIISFVISFSLIYVMCPLIKQSGKTPTMYIMKIERVGINNLSKLKSIDIFLSYIYNFFLSMPFLLFLPITYSGYSFIYALTLPIIPYASLLGSLLLIASLIITLVHPMNRSLSDLLSRSVLITTGDLDNVYYMKGYNDF